MRKPVTVESVNTKEVAAKIGEGVQSYLDDLNALDKHGVPIPMRYWMHCAGLNLDKLNHSYDPRTQAININPVYASKPYFAPAGVWGLLDEKCQHDMQALYQAEDRAWHEAVNNIIKRAEEHKQESCPTRLSSLISLEKYVCVCDK